MTTSGNELSLRSDSPAATEAIGRALGRAAEPGLVIALVGPLGAGKTLFVRAVAEGLDIADGRLICSPTFVLVQEYSARLPIFHFDVYRLTSPDQFTALGADEYFDAQGVCLVEWADRVARFLPEDLLTIHFAHHGANQRELTIQAKGARSLQTIERLRSGLHPECLSSAI